MENNLNNIYNYNFLKSDPDNTVIFTHTYIHIHTLNIFKQPHTFEQ